MLDITLLRKDLAGAVARLETRKKPQAFLDVAAFQTLESERKTIQMRTEELQSQRNTLSKQIGQLKARGAAGQAEGALEFVGRPQVIGVAVGEQNVGGTTDIGLDGRQHLALGIEQIDRRQMRYSRQLLQIFCKLRHVSSSLLLSI
ncbi:MAG: hypothetical protein WCL21_19310 [Mariniphaga sp.]